MATYTLNGRITPDHRLEVDVPGDIPPGDARITITLSPQDESRPRPGTFEAMLATLEEIRKMPGREYRTKEEIDADLNAMRDEWDDD